MNSSRYKKLIGLALGEKSLLAAELGAGDKPQVRKMVHWTFPEGLSLQEAPELGKALKTFLQQSGFTANAAVVGIPAKWLLVKAKEVPPADDRTLANMLRLQAETEFSSELRDLVYDYADDPDVKTARTVLLVAMQRKQSELAAQMCQAAGLKAVAVTPSALALGWSTGAALDREVLVLSVGQGGSELTAQAGGSSAAIRHLRGAEPAGLFVSELRRTVSTLPATPGQREMVVWGNGVDTDALADQVGFLVRRGKLPALGVDTSLAGANGDAHQYAAAVAVALAGMSERGPAVNFLHSRLAPPSERKIKQWMVLAAVVAIAAIGGMIYAYVNLQNQQADLTTLQATLAVQDPIVKDAKVFNNKVITAQKWHGENPRYLACLRDLTEAFSDDGQTYATTFTLTEITPQSSSVGLKDPDLGKLAGQLDGKTADQQRALALPDRLKVLPAFSEVNLKGTTYLPRERAVSFSITFKYDPTKAAP